MWIIKPDEECPEEEPDEEEEEELPDEERLKCELKRYVLQQKRQLNADFLKEKKERSLE